MNLEKWEVKITMEGTDSDSSVNISKVGTPTKDGAMIKPSSNKSGSDTLNALLVIGAILIVVALVNFVNETSSDLMPVTLIGLTLLFFGVGAFLYKKLEFLKPLAVTLIITSLASFPLLHYAYLQMGISEHLSGIFSELSTFTALVVACVLMRSRTLAYFAYFWLCMVIYAIVPHELPLEKKMYVYSLAPLIMAFPPMIAWATRAKWLPVYCRHAARSFSYVIMPVVGAVFLSVLSENDRAIAEMPFLATAITAISFIYYAIWAKISGSKKISYVARGVLQLFIMTFTWDFLAENTYTDSRIPNYRYSLTGSYYLSSIPAGHSGFIDVDMSRFILYLAWTISFMIQGIVALVSKIKTKIDEVGEKTFAIISIIGIYFTMCIFIAGISRESTVIPAVAQLTCVILSTLVCGGFGVLYAIHFKKIQWAIATSICVIGLPFYLDYLGDINFYGWPLFTYYAIATLLFSASYILLRRLNEYSAFIFSIISVALSGFLLIAAAHQLEIGFIGWLGVTTAVAGIAVAKKSIGLAEATIYLGAVTLTSISNYVIDHNFITGATSADYWRTVSKFGTIKFILGTHYLTGALMLAGYWRERGLTSKPRFNIGYYILTILTLFSAAAYNSEFHDLTPAALYLAEQAGFMVISMMRKYEYLTWSTLIAISLDILILSGSSGWLAMGAIGLLLLLVAAWKLTKDHQSGQAIKKNGDEHVLIAKAEAPKKADLTEIDDAPKLKESDDKDSDKKE